MTNPKAQMNIKCQNQKIYHSESLVSTIAVLPH